MTDTNSVKAMNVSPVAPKLSNNVSQYSPAPVVKTSPIRKQVTATTPTRIGFLDRIVTNSSKTAGGWHPLNGNRVNLIN